jgi:hypothetical protein
MLAMAMQESNHMDVRQRDDTKDGDPEADLSKSANCSIFNMSVVSTCTHHAGSVYTLHCMVQSQVITATGGSSDILLGRTFGECYSHGVC